MDKFQKSCCIFVAYLRSLYTLHQNNHWTCRGPFFYEEHLMFERIYQTAQKHSDEAAEKFVGLFGDECMTMAGQAECMNQILTKIKDDKLASSLKLEEEFLEYAAKFYQVLKMEHPKEFSLGLDDMIMSICNERESAVYLLRRSLLNQSPKKD